MKSLFYLSLLASGLVGAHAYGQSLYTLAGPVGLEESLPLKWTFNVAGGYDDNVNASNFNQQKVRLSVRTLALLLPITMLLPSMPFLRNWVVFFT